MLSLFVLENNIIKGFLKDFSHIHAGNNHHWSGPEPFDPLTSWGLNKNYGYISHKALEVVWKCWLRTTDDGACLSCTLPGPVGPGGLRTLTLVPLWHRAIIYPLLLMSVAEERWKSMEQFGCNSNRIITFFIRYYLPRLSYRSNSQQPTWYFWESLFTSCCYDGHIRLNSDIIYFFIFHYLPHRNITDFLYNLFGKDSSLIRL